MTHTKDEVLKLAIKKAHMLVQPILDKEVTTKELAKAVSDQAIELCVILKQALAAQPVAQTVAILNHAHGVYAFRSVNLQGLPDGEYQVYTTPPPAAPKDGQP
jgi:hypothetical protein